MVKWVKINTIAIVVLTIIFGIVTACLTYVSINQNDRLYLLEKNSFRADINVLINPISYQNWTFTSNKTFITIDGELFNEGARSTLITKVEVDIIYNFSDGTTYVDSFPSNFNNFHMEKYTIAPTEGRVFNMSLVAYPTIALNKITGEVIGIYSLPPDNIRVLVWHNDGEDEQLDNGYT